MLLSFFLQQLHFFIIQRIIIAIIIKVIPVTDKIKYLNGNPKMVFSLFTSSLEFFFVSSSVSDLCCPSESSVFFSSSSFLSGFISSSGFYGPKYIET